MTSILKEDDKIFMMYKQYQTLLETERKFKIEGGLENVAAQLTMAHMLDHVVCLLKKDQQQNNEALNG